MSAHPEVEGERCPVDNCVGGKLQSNEGGRVAYETDCTHPFHAAHSEAEGGLGRVWTIRPCMWGGEGGGGVDWNATIYGKGQGPPPKQVVDVAERDALREDLDEADLQAQRADAKIESAEARLAELVKAVMREVVDIETGNDGSGIESRLRAAADRAKQVKE